MNDSFQARLSLSSDFLYVRGWDIPSYRTNAGGERHLFFDEVQYPFPFVADKLKIEKGDIVRLELSEDGGPNSKVVLDVADLELVGAPVLPVSDNMLDFARDCGGSPSQDQHFFGPTLASSLQSCLDRAHAENRKAVYLPLGSYDFGALPSSINNPGVALIGAGKWHTVLRFSGEQKVAALNCGSLSQPSGCVFRDFAVFGGARDRNDFEANAAFGYQGAGVGTVIEDVWMEHWKVGFWVVGSAVRVFAHEGVVHMHIVMSHRGPPFHLPTRPQRTTEFEIVPPQLWRVCFVTKLGRAVCPPVNVLCPRT